MMSKKDQEHRDSTTDFFLKFISKEKEKSRETRRKASNNTNDQCRNWFKRRILC